MQANDISIHNVTESFVDKLLRKMRLARVLPSIKLFKNPRLLDIGCGFEAKLLQEIEDYIAKGVGIDYKAPEIHTDKIQTFSYIFESKYELGLETSQAIIGGGGRSPRKILHVSNHIKPIYPYLLKTKVLR